MRCPLHGSMNEYQENLLLFLIYSSLSSLRYTVVILSMDYRILQIDGSIRIAEYSMLILLSNALMVIFLHRHRWHVRNKRERGDRWTHLQRTNHTCTAVISNLPKQNYNQMLQIFSIKSCLNLRSLVEFSSVFQLHISSEPLS